MKKCPKCSRVYADESLNFCLDDGEWLEAVHSPIDAPTAIISGEDLSSERPTKIETPSQTLPYNEPKTSDTKSSKLTIVAAAAFILLGLVTVAAYKFNFLRKHADAAFHPGKLDRLTGTGNVQNAAISSDGKFVVYITDEGGKQSIWTRDVATTSTIQIVPPAETEQTGLSFSPDGNYVYYSRTEKGSGVSILYAVPKLGGTPKKLLSGVDSSVTFSPDGKRFAFLRDPDTPTAALIVANVDGTNEEKLASPGAPDVFYAAPAWSPDGTLIACPDYHTEGNSFYAMVIGVSIADGTIRPLSTKRWADVMGKMAWEPDGGALILAAREKRETFNDTQIWRLSYPDGAAQQITQSLTDYYLASLSLGSRSLVTITDEMSASIWIQSLNGPGGGASQLSQTPGTKDGYCGLAWTNSGTILFSAKQIADTDIWQMNVDGTGRQQLTDTQDVERYMSTPRDGRYIVFDLLRQGEGNVWRADGDGGGSMQLTSGSWNTEPDVAPDGKWVVYTDSDSLMWKVPIGGGQAVRLTDHPARHPAFSPDGKLIACYYKSGQNGPHQLALIPAEGGTPSRVFDVTAPNTGSSSNAPRSWVVLRWSPDGRSILYIDDKAGASNIWSQPVDGGAPKQITDFKSDLIWTFDISPDGKQLVMSRGRNIDDVVMISNANAQ